MNAIENIGVVLFICFNHEMLSFLCCL